MPDRPRRRSPRLRRRGPGPCFRAPRSNGTRCKNVSPRLPVQRYRGSARSPRHPAPRPSRGSPTEAPPRSETLQGIPNRGAASIRDLPGHPEPRRHLDPRASRGSRTEAPPRSESLQGIPNRGAASIQDPPGDLSPGIYGTSGNGSAGDGAAAGASAAPPPALARRACPTRCSSMGRSATRVRRTEAGSSSSRSPITARE